ncbi:hypothetical protein [Lysobacter sp. F6437]|uniref:hypothetical protein n=1 Tax=Lysobacter sp. F6437 TaxID=3459296 RepID=UPI00403E18A2
MNKLAPSLLATTALLVLAAPAWAQKPAGKKIYCWNDGDRKVCGDALPASAVDNARTEFSASGIATKRLDRAPTDTERAAAEAQAERDRLAALATAARQRKELAMVESYASEDDLKRAFDNRLGLLDASVKSSRLGVDGLRRSLVNLLQRASEAELAGKPVAKPLAGSIQSQHAALRRQQATLAAQQLERSTADEELAAALERYRELKKPAGDANG